MYIHVIHFKKICHSLAETLFKTLNQLHSLFNMKMYGMVSFSTQINLENIAESNF